MSQTRPLVGQTMPLLCQSREDVVLYSTAAVAANARVISPLGCNQASIIDCMHAIALNECRTHKSCSCRRIFLLAESTVARRALCQGSVKRDFNQAASIGS